LFFDARWIDLIAHDLVFLCNGPKVEGMSFRAIADAPYSRSSLDDFIDARLGKPSHPAHDPTKPDAPDIDPESKSARIAAFRKARAQRASGEGASSRQSRSQLTAVHLMSAEEVRSLFGDVTEGLNFLVSGTPWVLLLLNRQKHNKSILHLDLKPGNVLLTWDSTSMM
jgi:hypothetical protein